MLKVFDPATAPLEGVNLIEASAGTGKTYSIAALFLRLILKGAEVDHILVVTFTNAATEELQHRIRERLHHAYRLLLKGEYSEKLVETVLQNEEISEEDAIKRLQNALHMFDENGIRTIHGFCQTILRENAFESGAAFDTELIQDQSQLLQVVIDDFWRLHVANENPYFMSFLREKGVSPNMLMAFCQRHMKAQDFRILPKVQEESNAALVAYETALVQAKDCWEVGRDRIEEIFRSKNLKKVSYSIPRVEKALLEIDSLMRRRSPWPKGLKYLEMFTTEKVETCTIKNPTSKPEHPFFNAIDQLISCCEDLEKSFEKRLLRLRYECLREASVRSMEHKRAQNVQFYDDLLTRLKDALEGERGEELRRAIAQKFPIALIDEFQDTDPVQYGIFRHIYCEQNLPLFLIGDPKQSIYKFRGADIFAYLEAKADADHCYTQIYNWRSQPDLLEGFNAFYSRAKDPFLFDQIPYVPVTAPTEKGHQPILKINGRADAPLQMWFLNRQNLLNEPNRGDTTKKSIPKGEVREMVAKAVASEIILLTQQAKIGKDRVRPGDIAVLVKSHFDAHVLQKELLGFSIPTVRYTRESVFITQEAQDLEKVMRAVSRPNEESLVKGALLTDFFGCLGDELHDLMENEDDWERRLSAFRRYHEIWQEKGFIQMFRTLDIQEKVSERLLRFRDGERRLTNLMHTTELIQKEAVTNRLGVMGVLKWFAEQRSDLRKNVDSDEHRLRLESDDERVKIVTIHTSKGLEYPVVFCPYLCIGKEPEKEGQPVSFHDDVHGLTLDLGSEDVEKHREMASREEHAENLRLLYVAITRAKHRCYVTWGKVGRCEETALGYLLHQLPGGGDLVNATKERLKEISDGELMGDLREIEAKSDGAFAFPNLPKPGGAKFQSDEMQAAPMQARKFTGKISRSWRVTSYSALASGSSQDERPDHDALVAQATEADVRDAEGIFAFPKGALPGTFMHSIFETIDFRSSENEIEAVVQQKLEQFNFEEKWLPALLGMTRNVLRTELGGPNGPRLDCVPEERCLKELEFHFPLEKEVYAKKVMQVFHRHHEEDVDPIGKLDFPAVKGFMKGYIDLVFEHQGRYFIVDFKSNNLGASLDAYDQSILKSVMADQGYVLQYHLYSVALHRYLESRMRGGYDFDEHFGGIYYLFLRGMDPSSGARYGVYYDCPSKALIEELSEVFGG